MGEGAMTDEAMRERLIDVMRQGWGAIEHVTWGQAADALIAAGWHDGPKLEALDVETVRSFLIEKGFTATAHPLAHAICERFGVSRELVEAARVADNLIDEIGHVYRWPYNSPLSARARVLRAALEKVSDD